MVDRENRIILILVGFLTFTTLVHIVSFECFFSTSDTASSRINITSINEVREIRKPVIAANGDKVKSDVEVKKSIRPLEEILKLAGVDVDEELKQSLPPLEGIMDMYGPEPIIIGTDRCETFRKTIIKGEGFVGPAGMFNTGTNLLAELLKKNCYLPDRVEKHGRGNFGIRDQVPWGKHSPVGFRNHHKTASGQKVNQTSFFPAVVIKDPYTWMDSMCRHHYEAHWTHSLDHCPNLVPTTESEVMELKGEKTYKVWVRYNPDPRYYDSMAHLWSEWYQDWIDAEFPRLMIRFEDLIFHTESVVEQVCSCSGGKAYEGPFKYIQDSAKGDKQSVHKGGNGLVKSIQKYGYPANRVKSFQSEDLEYAKDNLSRDVMEMFHYSTPS